MSSTGLKHLLFAIAAFAALLIANVAGQSSVGAKSHTQAAPSEAAAPAEISAPASSTEFQTDMRQVITKMDEDLRTVPVSGNPDCDFVATMIPHHQAAIDLAKSYLKHAKDSRQIELANKIIAEHEKALSDLRERYVASRAVGGKAAE